MMATLGSFTTGQILSAAEMNKILPMTVVRLTAVLSIATAVQTVLPWAAGSELADDLNWHNDVTNNSRITPTIAGLYLVQAAATYAANGGVGDYIRILLNGATYADNAANHAATGANSGLAMATLVVCNGTTDYLELAIYQNSGGAINVNNRQLSVALIRKT